MAGRYLQEESGLTKWSRRIGKATPTAATYGVVAFFTPFAVAPTIGTAIGIGATYLGLKYLRNRSKTADKSIDLVEKGVEGTVYTVGSMVKGRQ